MSPSTLKSHCILPRCFIALAVALAWGSCRQALAAQQTFWPFNSFPPTPWSLSSTDSTTTAASVPGVGTITSRRFVITNFSNPTALPSFGNETIYNNASTRMDFETSLDGGANWLPYTGSGAMSIRVNYADGPPALRLFLLEVLSLDVPVNGSAGAAVVRESPTLPSTGQLIVTSTNGGNFFSGYVNLALEVSVNNGVNWFASSPAVYVELRGPAGIPSTMSITKSSATQVTICWSTQTGGDYQLQRKGSLNETNWTNVGVSQAGTGATICLSDTLDATSNQFYRVQLSP